MTVIDADAGDNAQRPVPPILPFDVARRPRYASASSPWPGETHAAEEVCPQLAEKPQGGRPETPPLIDRIIEHFASLTDGGGDLGMELAGAIMEAGNDKRARARALCRVRKRGQHSADTKLATIERRERIRDFAAAHPGMSTRAIAARLRVSDGTVRRALNG